jgi:AraC-like DNA-binding protein
MQDVAQDGVWAVSLIDSAIAGLQLQSCDLGGPRDPGRSDGVLIVHPSARLAVTLSGRYRRRISIGGQASEIDGEPGSAVFLAPRAWDLRLVGEAFVCLGLVFAPGYLRVLEGRHPGGIRRAIPAARWHHTPGPLNGPGAQVVAALSHRAEAGLAGGTADGHLLAALLHLARQHCLASGGRLPRGTAAWQAMHEYLHEHAHEDLSRDGVARRFRLHPTYLSELCVRHGGEGFHGLLEGVRLERVRNLLAAGSEPVGGIARTCGFRDVGTCIRAFRRRFGTTPQRWRRSLVG